MEGGSYVESESFTVAVGAAYRLALETDILEKTIVSGAPFPEQVQNSRGAIVYKKSVRFDSASLSPTSDRWAVNIHLANTMQCEMIQWGASLA